MPLHRDPVTADVVQHFGRIVDRYNYEYDSAAARNELTRLQARALLFVEDPKSMRELAQHLRSEPPNVTGIVDRLESRGLVERVSDEGDRRVKLTAATEAGRTIAKDFKNSLNFAAEPLAGLNERERRQLRDLLRKLRDAAENTTALS